MSGVSDRAYFLEQIKNNPMTITQIKDEFGCADSTARLWVRHEQVEKVEGSYPPAYVRKDTLVFDKKKSAGVEVSGDKPNKIMIEFDRPSDEAVEGFFRKVLAGEAGKLDFVSEFRAIDSQKELHVLVGKLKSALIVTEYYRSLMIKDGIE